MNGVDLNRFPFEYDLTWMSFFQDSQGRTYARYGGRDDTGPESHLNQKSLVRIMKQTLELHKTGSVQPNDRYEPATADPLTPEQIPTMRQMMEKRKVKCIHCHDVKSTRLKNLRLADEFNKKMIYTYPSPSNLGINLDPVSQNQVKSVANKSSASSAGMKAGDILLQMGGHRVLTFADATRVLELTPETGDLAVQIQRGGTTIDTILKLPVNWRISQDPSWRESTHVAGPNSGFWAVELNEQQRKNLNIPSDQLALRATAIWGAWTKKSGIRHGDIVVSIDGLNADMGIKQLQTYLQMNKTWGETVPILVIRNGKRMELSMKLPPQPKQ